jgi:hypothetical protein
LRNRRGDDREKGRKNSNVFHVVILLILRHPPQFVKLKTPANAAR